MFRRLYGSFFRFAQQTSAQFAKGSFSQSRRRWITGLVGVQVGAAAAVGISDAELLKKPEWYQEAVHDLELAVKRTNKQGYIETNSALDHDRAILQKFNDLNNPELLWRLARVLVEKSDLVVVDKEKELLLREAVEVAGKALSFEAKPCAGIHKWYAIALSKLLHYDKKLRKTSSHLVRQHLESSVDIDSKDPYTWVLLGLENFRSRDYKDAIRCYRKAEEISPDFSAANHFYMGETYMKLREKKTALEEYKKVFKVPIKYREDLKAKVDARKILNDLKVSRDEFDPIKEDF